jgi:hypothetical protein
VATQGLTISLFAAKAVELQANDKVTSKKNLMQRMPDMVGWLLIGVGSI